LLEKKIDETLFVGNVNKKKEWQDTSDRERIKKRRGVGREVGAAGVFSVDEVSIPKVLQGKVEKERPGLARRHRDKKGKKKICPAFGLNEQVLGQRKRTGNGRVLKKKRRGESHEKEGKGGRAGNVIMLPFIMARLLRPWIHLGFNGETT